MSQEFAMTQMVIDFLYKFTRLEENVIYASNFDKIGRLYDPILDNIYPQST